MALRTRDYYIGCFRFADNKVLLKLRNGSEENPLFIKLKYTDDIALRLDICNMAINDYVQNSAYKTSEDSTKLKLMVCASYFYDNQYRSEIVPYEDIDYIINKSKEMNTMIGSRMKTIMLGVIDSEIPQNYASVIEFKDISNTKDKYIFNSLEEYYKYDEDLLCHLV